MSGIRTSFLLGGGCFVREKNKTKIEPFSKSLVGVNTQQICVTCASKKYSFWQGKCCYLLLLRAKNSTTAHVGPKNKRYPKVGYLWLGIMREDTCSVDIHLGKRKMLTKKRWTDRAIEGTKQTTWVATFFACLIFKGKHCWAQERGWVVVGPLQFTKQMMVAQVKHLRCEMCFSVLKPTPKW